MQLCRLSLVLALVVPLCASCSQGPPRDSRIPPDATLQRMCRATLLEFHGALQSGDFTKFHAEISDAWQDAASPDDLAGIYAPLVEGRVSLAPVEQLEATFDPPPFIDAAEILNVPGWYPITPRRVYFRVKYIQEEGEWRPYGVSVEIN